MARYPQGQPVRVSTTVRDTTGALVDAGALTLTVKLAQADGTQATTGTYASPAHDGVGLYHVDVPAVDLTATGHYQYAWVSTGTGAGVAPGDFDVYDPYEVAVICPAGREGRPEHPAGHHQQRHGDPGVHRRDRGVP